MRYNWHKLGIDVGRIHKEGKTKCPKCGPTSKHKQAKNLSVNVETGDYNCHNTPCDFRGNAGRDDILSIQREKKVYDKPVPKLQKVSDSILTWFKSRGISNETLLIAKVTEGVHWMPQQEKEVPTICFNYYRGEELVNVKYRARGKQFSMAKNCELIFYNLNCLTETERKFVIIVEGEVDALTWIECGIYGVISVPNGAALGQALRLEYVDNCWRELENIEGIIIATDADEAGQLLQQELIRRLGPERCYTVQYPEGCKDTNEVFLRDGKAAVLDMLTKRRQVPIDGVLTIDDIKQAAKGIYDYGYPKTLRIGWQLDQHITWRQGETTAITGIPNHGKSTWLNSLLVALAEKHNWLTAIFSPEKNPPEELVAELASVYIGKPYFKADPYEKMTTEEWAKAMDFIDQHFLFINLDEDVTLDQYLDIIRQLITRYGINAAVADPWNYFEHDRERQQTETDYVNIQLGKICKNSRRVDVHQFIVAHPTKMQKDKKHRYLVPQLYDISGSAHWYNRIDNGICIYRNFEDGTTSVYIHKVRRFYVGRGGGMVKMLYDSRCQRFTDYTPPVEKSPEEASYEEKVANQKLGDRGRELQSNTIAFPPVAKDDLPF